MTEVWGGVGDRRSAAFQCCDLAFRMIGIMRYEEALRLGMTEVWGGVDEGFPSIRSIR